HTMLEQIDALEFRGLAADEAEHDAFVLDETQRFEIAGPLRVEFQQEMIDPGSAEKPLRDRLIAAGCEIVPLEIAAADMDPEDHARRGCRDRLVEAFDIEIDQMVRFLSGILDALAHRRVAQLCNGDLVQLNVAATSVGKLGDFISEYA